MNTREFLETVWPVAGPYCIARPWILADGKATYAHRGVDTIDDAITYIMRERNNVDLFFAIHSLKEKSKVNPNTGKLKTYRTHENMKEARAFFFDLDVGVTEPDKLPKYASQQDARDGLDKFLFNTNLPSPFVTSSGNGLHVYWMIEEPIASEVWRTPADKLHWLAKENGLLADPSRTTDQSSVLRIPFTFNLKDKTKPKRVEILQIGDVTPTEDFLNELDALTGDRYTPVHYVSPTSSKSPGSVNFTGRITPSDEVPNVCEQIRIFRDKQGKISEPHWHVSIGVMKYTDGADTIIHQWSAGHPNYDFSETQTKIENWKTDVPSCAKIKANCDPAVCDRCPFKDGSMGHNPLVIANNVWNQTAAPPPTLTLANVNAAPKAVKLCDPPFPFQRTPTGIIEHKKRTPGEEDDPAKPKFVKLSEYDMFPITMYWSIENERGFSKWAIQLPIAGQRIINIPNSALETNTLNATLVDEGMIVESNKIPRILEFMKAYLRELQKQQLSAQQFDHVGWDAEPKDSLNPKGFILYDRKLSMIDGQPEACAMSRSTKDIAAYMSKVGSMQKQIDMFDFYDHDAYIPHQFMIGAALATPWVLWSNQHGAVLNITGDTGGSKSTVLYVLSALWGDPKHYGISGLKSGSTEKARFERGAILRNLPFVVDEITLLEPDIARELVMGASQPPGITTLTSNRIFRIPRKGVKANIMFTSSNQSLAQLVSIDNKAGQAALARIFEILVERNTVRNKIDADAMMRTLASNHGWIGEAFMSALLPSWDKVGEAYIKGMTRFEQAIKAGQEERFISMVATAGLLGLRSAHKLGLMPFDWRKSEEWLIEEQVPRMRGVMMIEKDRRSPDNVINDYLETNSGKMSRVEADSHGNIGGVVYIPSNEIVAHYSINDNEIWVRKEPFRIFCHRNGYDAEAIIDTLFQTGAVSRVSIRKEMAFGTSAQKARSTCFIIDMKKAGIKVSKTHTPTSDDA